MLKSDKLEFEPGAAAKAKTKIDTTAEKNRHHDRYGTAGSLKSPASLGPVEILSKDRRLFVWLARFLRHKHHVSRPIRPLRLYGGRHCGRAAADHHDLSHLIPSSNIVPV
jgi:hypothetical protein